MPLRLQEPQDAEQICLCSRPLGTWATTEPKGKNTTPRQSLQAKHCVCVCPGTCPFVQLFIIALMYTMPQYLMVLWLTHLHLCAVNAMGEMGGGGHWTVHYFPLTAKDVIQGFWMLSRFTVLTSFVIIARSCKLISWLKWSVWVVGYGRPGLTERPVSHINNRGLKLLKRSCSEENQCGKWLLEASLWKENLESHCLSRFQPFWTVV